MDVCQRRHENDSYTIHTYACVGDDVTCRMRVRLIWEAKEISFGLATKSPNLTTKAIKPFRYGGGGKMRKFCIIQALCLDFSGIRILLIKENQKASSCLKPNFSPLATHEKLII